jgi:CPA2 family monovalent cation:H+ antiporter-2
VFGAGSLDAGTLLGLGLVLVAIAAATRLATGRGIETFPVPLLIGLVVSAAGPLDMVRPDAAIARAGAEIAVVMLLFCVGLDHAAVDRRTATATRSAGRLLAVDAALNFIPGALFGILAGFGPTGAVLLGGATWASSWAMASGLLDREGRYGNRETPAVLAVLVLEHTATAFYLPLAAALLAPGDAAARLTALLGSAAAVAFAAWLVVGPAPVLRTTLFAWSGPGVALPLLLTGAALALAGLAAAMGVATAAVAYLAGAVLGSPAGELPPAARRSVEVLRDLSGAAAGLALGLLVPSSKLPGAVAAGLALAAVTGAAKVLTGWWAAGRLHPTGGGPLGAVGPAGRLRAGLALVPRGELALSLGILTALSAPGRGPGPGLAALLAVEVALTGVAPSLVRLRRRPGWYRWAPPTPAAVRPDPRGAC